MPTGDPDIAVRSPATVSEFLEVATPLLLVDESRHNLILGLSSTLRDHPQRYPEHRLWVAERAGEVVAAALRTPPHNLVLARAADDEATRSLAAAIDDSLPGVVAALPEAEVFASAWTAHTGATSHVVRRQRIHAATAIREVGDVGGAARQPGPHERDLVLEWYRAFVVEATGETAGGEQLERAVDHSLAAADAGFLLWDDGGPVSFAGYGGQTPSGVRIGPVYTPPEHRGRGYASALVARLSRDLLDEGRTFCFLYTDLANPTANRLYARLGYAPVCDALEIAFAP